MNTKDVNRILGIHPDLVDREFPSDGRTFHLMSEATTTAWDDSKDQPERWYHLGMSHIEKGNTELGKRFLVAAYKRGNAGAGNDYAYGLTHGWFGERDYATAVSIYRKLARKGDRNAMNNYAFAYLDGLGVNKNRHLAEHWLMKAIEKGNTDSAVSYAQLTFDRVFPNASWNLAIWLCFWAADKGNAGAMNELGLFYEETFSMVRDWDKAYEWFKKSVEHGGGACAEFNLSRCYRYGIGVEMNDKIADAWQNLAVEHGFDIEAYNKLYDLR